MMSFGQRMAARRKEQGMAQAEMAKKLATSTSVIGRYERGEMTPSIEAAQKIAELLDTTVAWLLGEVDEGQTLKDAAMLRRLNEIAGLAPDERERLLFVIDAMLREAKTRKAYAS